MKKLLFSLFSIFVLLAFPLQANELDMSILNDLEIPTIVGPDDREEITGKAVGPEKAVVVIEYLNQFAMPGICSGALVGPNIVLTAAHCIVTPRGDYFMLETVYAVGMPQTERTDNIPEISDDTPEISDDTPEISENTLRVFNAEKAMNTTPILPWLVPPGEGLKYPHTKAKQLWVPDEFKQAIRNNKKVNQYDYGIIVLNHNLSEKTEEYLKLKVLSDEELEDASIVAIGRGDDKPRHSLWKSPGDIGEVSEYFIKYDTDVYSGNSGSPIFKEGDPENIIALVNWALVREEHVNEGYPNEGLRIRQEIIDAVETVANGGTLPGMKILRQ